MFSSKRSKDFNSMVPQEESNPFSSESRFISPSAELQAETAPESTDFDGSQPVLNIEEVKNGLISKARAYKSKTPQYQ